MKAVTLTRLPLFALAPLLTASLAGCIPKDGPGASGAMGGNAPAAPAPDGGNLLKMSDFNDGKSLPWMTSFTTPGAGSAAVKDGVYCLAVDNAGENPWDAQFRHREMVIQKGHTYTVQFTVRASEPTKARPKIGMSQPPYKEYWWETIEITTEPQVIKRTFTMHDDDDPTAEFAFHLGGGLSQPAAGFEVCVDDVYLADTDFTPPPEDKDEPVRVVRVNQVGYLPNLPKIAALVNASKEPVAFEVLDAQGQVVFEGKTKVFGDDKDSGEHLHHADFSSLAPGSGYVVRVGDDKSYAFDVRADLYSQMRTDALLYFYHNRSGIEIQMPFARQEQWARPAGHASSDKNVACAKDAGCSYSLDVSGGWYDAGDHGKYVVNGGISVWTLMNQYERTQHLKGDLTKLGDSTLKIPESGNGTPDILDEARWELEFLMRMQVPAGRPNAGMVHHKIHDEAWTALGIAPHDAEQKMKRYLRPVSTAATLNVAATAALCARIFEPFDAAFAARCLKSAERAWAAAKKTPDKYAPASDDTGGGPYDDTDVSDEFYWAAAELFITTQDPKYKRELMASKYARELPITASGAGGGGAATAMTWQQTAALGTISLAVVPNGLSKAQVQAERTKLVQLADMYLSFIGLQGHGMPFKAASGYPWGSNSMILNNMLVLALAHDFEKDDRYLTGVSEGMAYILGRNALSQSYVTGYGERPLNNPHHRFWSHQADARFPSAPPGVVSGGPNSSIQDPYAKAAGLEGCVAQKCFMDHIESWSTNEITINWNAPFAWVAAFLDENAAQK